MIRLTLVFLLLVNATAIAADKIRLQLNWVPEPEFGGIYQAKVDGIFEKHELDVDVTPGGAGAPTWQLVAAGRIDFAVASADEILIARQQKADVVALFATYQICPQGIMTHASSNAHSLADLWKSEGKLAVEPGQSYVEFLNKLYGPSKLEMVTYDGGIAAFQRDKTLAQQCFVTSEPIAAKRAGVDPKVFLIADAGYNPYSAVIITRGEYARSHPALVKQLVASLKQGWSAYLADPMKANAAMQKLNPEMDIDTFAAASAAQKPLIETPETKSAGLGCMSDDRWASLGKQLTDLHVITSAAAPKECYVQP